jgi:hypothetical protein
MRPGHYERIIPAGYAESLRDDNNQLADPALHALYEDLRLITLGPLWSSARWAAIWRQNTAPRQDFTRYATPITQRHQLGNGDSTAYHLSAITGLRLLPKEGMPDTITLTYQSMCDVVLTQHFHNGKIKPIWLSPEYPDTLPIVKKIAWPAGLDSVSIYPIGECDGGAWLRDFSF